MKREKLQAISQAIGTRKPVSVLRAIRSALKNENGRNWKRDFAKFVLFLADGIPRFSVFAKHGNKKLPFLAFSSLPGKPYCIGSGSCLEFCYSFRAWRYPAAFLRQAQNTILLQTADGRSRILAELDKHKTGQAIDFRLYVDGDFDSAETLEFWLEAIRLRPWLRAYGYSKSFELFLEYRGEFPGNYLLNISSGHRYSAAVVKRVKALPITRGEFRAINIGRKVKGTEHGTLEIARILREKNGGKLFSCPGNCGNCIPSGHACGADSFRGITIGIAVH